MTEKQEKDKVHIAMVGETVENVMAGIMLKGAKELYPIISENFRDSAYEALVEKLPGIKVHRKVRDKELVIDPFTEDSFKIMVELIIDIVQYHKDKDVEFWINITGGTNLMSAAAEAGAVLTKSKAYYVVEDRDGEGAKIIVLPWHAINPHNLQGPRLSILKAIETRPLPNKGIVDKLDGKISSKSMVHYLKELAAAGYILRKRQGRLMVNELTSWGKIALRLGG